MGIPARRVHRARDRTLAVALGVVLLAAACGRSRPASGPGAASGTGAGAASTGASPDQTVPSSPAELPDVSPEGFQALLATLRGKPVVVNIWASWCGPCILEAPVLAAKAKQYSGKVQFLGVDIIDHRPPAREFIQRFGWPYPSVFDPTGAIRDSLGLIGQPHTVIYDASGTQVFVWSGAISEATLDEELSKVVAA